MKRFITICFLFTLSSIVYSQGMIFQDSLFSKSLNEIREFNIYLPDVYDPNDTTQHFPVVYFLHSLLGDRFERNREISSAMRTLLTQNIINPMIIVIPNSNMNPNTFPLPWVSSWYVNSELHGLFEDYFTNDLVDHIDSMYNTIPSRNKRSIFGHSSGGYGSLKFGFKHSEIYTASAALDGYVLVTTLLYDESALNSIKLEYSASGHFDPTAGWASNFMFSLSGAFSPNLHKPPYFVDLPLDTNFVLIDSVIDKWEPQSITHIATQYSNEKKLAIYLDSGTPEKSDYNSNKELMDTLDVLNIPYSFYHFDGGHTSFMTDRISRSLTFIDSVMWYGYPRAYNSKAVPKFVRPSMDTITITTEITNPSDHSLKHYALIIDDDGSVEYTKELTTNGNGLLQCTWALPGEEKFYRVDLQIDDLDSINMSNRLYTITCFTTAGPVIIDTCDIAQISDMNKIRIANITVTNKSNQKVIPKVVVRITCEDTSIVNITGLKSYGNLAPGETKTIGGGIYVDVDTIKNYTFVAEIRSNNVVYWKDTIEFIPTPVSVEDDTNLPSEYSLFQNYPNPFNPSTTIKYSIPRHSVDVGTSHDLSVQLKIYDVLGKEITTLINKQQKPGYYEVNWNAVNQASGIYFYKLSVGSFVSTKKMILLR